MTLTCATEPAAPASPGIPDSPDSPGTPHGSQSSQASSASNYYSLFDPDCPITTASDKVAPALEGNVEAMSTDENIPLTPVGTEAAVPTSPVGQHETNRAKCCDDKKYDKKKDGIMHKDASSNKSVMKNRVLNGVRRTEQRSASYPPLALSRTPIDMTEVCKYLFSLPPITKPENHDSEEYFLYQCINIGYAYRAKQYSIASQGARYVEHLINGKSPYVSKDIHYDMQEDILNRVLEEDDTRKAVNKYNQTTRQREERARQARFRATFGEQCQPTTFNTNLDKLLAEVTRHEKPVSPIENTVSEAIEVTPDIHLDTDAKLASVSASDRDEEYESLINSKPPTINFYGYDKWVDAEENAAKQTTSPRTPTKRRREEAPNHNIAEYFPKIQKRDSSRLLAPQPAPKPADVPLPDDDDDDDDVITTSPILRQPPKGCSKDNKSVSLYGLTINNGERMKVGIYGGNRLSNLRALRDLCKKQKAGTEIVLLPPMTLYGDSANEFDHKKLFADVCDTATKMRFGSKCRNTFICDVKHYSRIVKMVKKHMTKLDAMTFEETAGGKSYHDYIMSKK